MKKTFRKTSAMLCAITVMASSMSFSSFVANADGEPVTSDYTLNIPATLAVANSGWNSTAGISATGTLATGKKLVVTATSDDEFALVSGENKVNYKLAESGDNTTTFDTATEKTSWEFTTLSETAATQTMGIVVEDYSEKPAGTYQDTVTFTASVEEAAAAILYVSAASKVNDVVKFGDYDWYVIGTSDNGVTLLMKNNLMNKAYNDSATSVTWETCALRTYLNGDFYNRFSDEDRAKIVKTSNTNPNNPDHGTKGGNNTEDYIYLLSIAEANNLDNSIRPIGSWWWLRSPGYNSYYAAFVYEGGIVNTIGRYVSNEYGVRPALNLEF